MVSGSKLLKALPIALVFAALPVTAQSQNSGFTTHELCKQGDPGCNSGTTSNGTPKQNIPKGYYRSEPRDTGSGIYTNEVPRVRVPVRNITCNQGKRILRDVGYLRVRTIFCAGPFYTYRARISGRSYVLTIRRANGEIVNRYRI